MKEGKTTKTKLLLDENFELRKELMLARSVNEMLYKIISLLRKENEGWNIINQSQKTITDGILGNTYAVLLSTYAVLKNTYAVLEISLAEPTNAFAVLSNCFAVLKNTLAVTKNTLAVLENSSSVSLINYAVLENSLAVLPDNCANKELLDNLSKEIKNVITDFETISTEFIREHLPNSEYFDVKSLTDKSKDELLEERLTDYFYQKMPRATKANQRVAKGLCQMTLILYRKERVKNKEIATNMGVNRNTVTNFFDRLKEWGMSLHWGYGYYYLTDKGREDVMKIEHEILNNNSQ